MISNKFTLLIFFQICLVYGQQCKIPGQWGPGSVIADYLTNVPSYENCQVQCYNDTECHFFTHYENNNECLLFTSQTGDNQFLKLYVIL